MLYRVRSTGAVKNQGGIRKMFPNISLPRQWNQSVYDILGIDPVEPTSPPTITDLQAVYENGVEQDENGNWKQAWLVKSKFNDYEKEVTEGNTTITVTVTQKEQEDAYLAEKLSNKATEKRAERNQLLKDTDWLVIKAQETGVSLSAEWSNYRQALRDITEDADWPDVELPIPPK